MATGPTAPTSVGTWVARSTPPPAELDDIDDVEQFMAVSDVRLAWVCRQGPEICVQRVGHCLLPRM